MKFVFSNNNNYKQKSRAAQSVYLDGSGLHFRYGKETLISSKIPRPPLGPTQPLLQWVPGRDFPGVKRPGREVNHATPSTAEAKNINCTIHLSPPLYTLMTLTVEVAPLLPLLKRIYRPVRQFKYRIFSNLIRTLFHRFRGLKNQTRIRFAVESWILEK
jgi:hypothetical protein